ncbi:MAG: o-succinylbenzoate synthase [Deltaproteobacteria bacterium]|nr:o-succinylbenzoate synthase [Deltaproteobacteria bacterium]
MIRLETLTLREIRLPLRQPFVSSAGTVEVRRSVLTELVTDTGVIAWGECVALEEPSYLPETLEAAWHALGEWIGPLVLGSNFRQPEEVGELLQRKIRGHRMARAAVEMPCWVVEALQQRKSLAALLGGERSRVATGVALGLAGGIPETVAQAQQAVQEGYQRIKLKITPGMDFDLVAAVREAVGPEVMLTVDANAAYTPDSAAALERLDTLHLGMIEQPLSWEDLARHAELRDQLETPLCLDESVTSVERARRMVELGSATVLNLKAGRVGGLGPALEIHQLCRDHGIPLWCGGMLESGIGRAYNVALASLPGFDLPGDLSPSARYWRRDVVTPPWTMDAEGWVQVPRHQPGLGVEVDRDYIDDLTVRKKVLAP